MSVAKRRRGAPPAGAVRDPVSPRGRWSRAGARESAVHRAGGPLRRVLGILGPGLITGVSDDDPSGVGTYAVAGATFGFATLWTTLVTVPMMVAVQFMSAKVGQVTGVGLAAVLRRHYPRAVLYPAVFALAATNTINAGVDIRAIAAAANLLVPVPIAAMIVPIAVVILVLQVWGNYRTIVAVFKLLALAFLTYIGAAVLARPAVWDVLKGTFVPAVRLDGSFLATLVALFGTTISPYMWFWQASQEVEDEIAVGHRRLRERRGTTDGELRYAAWDINAGMLFSNVVAYFIILATAATLFKAGKTDITSAAQAAEALRPLAGNAAGLLFALGLLSSGFLAVPVLTGSAAYAVAETFRWKHGLDEPLRRARQFYLVIAASTIVGMLVNFVGINPIRALFWTAVLNGFLTPPLLFLVMLVSNNRKIMGDRVNGPVLNAVGWLTFAVMVGAVAGLVATWGR